MEESEEEFLKNCALLDYFSTTFGGKCGLKLFLIIMRNENSYTNLLKLVGKHNGQRQVSPALQWLVDHQYLIKRKDKKYVFYSIGPNGEELAILIKQIIDFTKKAKKFKAAFDKAKKSKL